MLSYNFLQYDFHIWLRLLSHQFFGLLHSSFCYLFAPFLQLDFHRLQQWSPGSLYSLSRRRIVCKCLRLPAFVFKLLLQLLAFFMEFLFAFIGIVTWTGLPTMAGLVTLFSHGRCEVAEAKIIRKAPPVIIISLTGFCAPAQASTSLLNRSPMSGAWAFSLPDPQNFRKLVSLFHGTLHQILFENSQSTRPSVEKPFYVRRHHESFIHVHYYSSHISDTRRAFQRWY